MYIVLLSGGSGKRLWPLSNDLCSKQYIKLMNPDEAEHSESTEKCSMLQRVFGQLKAASLSENTIVCASDSQVELIESQLDGQAEVALSLCAATHSRLLCYPVPIFCQTRVQSR